MKRKFVISLMDREPAVENFLTRGLVKPDTTNYGKPLVVFDVIDGRLTRRQVTNRPPHVWPEIWEGMSKKMRKKATAEWDRDEKLIDEARSRRGLALGVDGGTLSD